MPFTVTLQVWLPHDRFPTDEVPAPMRSSKLVKPMKVDQTVLERDLKLPFAPYPGLVLWLGERGETLQDEAEVETVFYNQSTGGFVCKVKPRILSGVGFEKVAENYIDAGWRLKKQ